ncbi:efflux RND transporter periplasmic adaptor subunit [Halomonas alkalisoli]|uniref:efflux RND transporter periplasmic adaptor subunit n=1 Tax=Halomonas alkalisoli TaxID=2907158 RepID=UPI001F29E757|nr:efflux RND transporter periplasmic adaptor subunit [Halomonas alkalisoli]MCE9684345.1 efflux RND transporter periplasmic adaptor subunit [Halomonas alkalisoli]
MRQSRRVGLAMAALGLLALLGGCDRAPAASQAVNATVDTRAAVRVSPVRSSAGDERIRFPGIVRPKERVSPAFLHAGVLSERLVERGQRVEKGEPLARLHNPALEPALAGAEGRVRELDAHLARLGRDVERARALRERNLVAQEELDRLVSEREATVQAREQAVASRADARAQVEEMTLRAPFAADVADLFVEAGDFVAAGEPVLALSGVDGVEVAIRVPAMLGARLTAGLTAQVSPTLHEGRFQGRISSVGRAGSALVPVVVELDPDPRLAPGESVQVSLAVPMGSSLQVPLSAVQDPGGHAPYVLALTDDETVRRVAVAPGRLADGWVTISAPLSPGDRVVVAGQGRLQQGDSVRVLR